MRKEVIMPRGWWPYRAIRPCSHFSQRCQNPAWRERHFAKRLGAKRAQRIIDGVHHRAGRARGAGFARTLGAELGIRRRCHDMADFDIGHLRRHGNEVVDHVAVEQLAALVIDAVLEQGRADSLHHTAPDLLIDELRVYHGAAILDAPVLKQSDEAAFHIDFEIARLMPLVKANGHLRGT